MAGFVSQMWFYSEEFFSQNSRSRGRTSTSSGSTTSTGPSRSQQKGTLASHGHQREAAATAVVNASTAPEAAAATRDQQRQRTRPKDQGPRTPPARTGRKPDDDEKIAGTMVNGGSCGCTNQHLMMKNTMISFVPPALSRSIVTNHFRPFSRNCL